MVDMPPHPRPHELEWAEPVSGSRVQITIKVDGHVLIDTDLTRAWLRTLYGAEDVLTPFYFTPFTPPDDDGTAEPAQPVRALLRLTPYPVGE